MADERGKLFAEITDALRVALDNAERAPNPFRGDVAAAASYAHAYGRAFAWGVLGVGGWSHPGGDAAFARGWSEGIRDGFLVWAAMADKYGYKW